MKRTRLDVSDALRAYAEQYGAYFDKKTGAWYVDGEMPLELEELVAATPWRSYTEGLTQASALTTGSLEARHSASRQKKVMPAELLARISYLTDLVEKLSGDRRVAIRWLETPMLSLGRQTPLNAMMDLNGCDQVEELLRKTFDS
jgi:uncharacterized protein (DUF2384 family)